MTVSENSSFDRFGSASVDTIAFAVAVASYPIAFAVAVAAVLISSIFFLSDCVDAIMLLISLFLFML